VANLDYTTPRSAKQWNDFKIGLRRAFDNHGDQNAGVMLHDIIVEETALLWQKRFKTASEKHHLKLMERLSGGPTADGAPAWFSEADWDKVTAGGAVAYYTAYVEQAEEMDRG